MTIPIMRYAFDLNVFQLFIVYWALAFSFLTAGLGLARNKIVVTPRLCQEDYDQIRQEVGEVMAEWEAAKK